jgi:hypothetical protein
MRDQQKKIVSDNRDFFILGNELYFQIIFKAVFFVAIIVCFYFDGDISLYLKFLISYRIYI